MEVDDDDQDPPYVGRGAWNVLDYHWIKGNYAENVNAPSSEWGARVTEFLQLYVDVTDPRLKAWTNNLSFQDNCQAITQVARQNGHTW
eukprot:6043110-Pyramimonas_sp.AAC.1